MSRALLEAELTVRRRRCQHELWQVLGLPSRWAHRRADLLLDRIDWIDYIGAEWARGAA